MTTIEDKEKEWAEDSKKQINPIAIILVLMMFILTGVSILVISINSKYDKEIKTEYLGKYVIIKQDTLVITGAQNNKLMLSNGSLIDIEFADKYKIK